MIISLLLGYLSFCVIAWLIVALLANPQILLFLGSGIMTLLLLGFLAYICSPAAP